MFAILFKDFGHQKWVLTVGFGFILSFSLLIVSPKAQAAPLALVFFPAPVVLISILSMLAAEIKEDQNHGYLLLSCLPISKLGVMTAKFLNIFLVTFAVYLFSLLMISFRPGVLPAPVMLRGLLHLTFGLTLAATALGYMGMYLLGMILFGKIMLVALVGAQVLGVGASLYLVENQTLLDPGRIAEWITALNPLPVWLIACALFLLVFCLTNVFERRL
ncbi:MAG: ABC-2 transporter permease [Anaerolineaceae bacterium]|nr:ABC-2 transporter permease [Anaerolineaceae bacterium]